LPGAQKASDANRLTKTLRLMTTKIVLLQFSSKFASCHFADAEKAKSRQP